MTIRYVNSKGKEVNLNKKSYRMLISDILDYEWDIITDDEMISGFRRTMSTRKINIDVLKTGQKNARELINDLTDIFDVDIVNEMQGKLYFDDWYLPCFIYSSSKERWESSNVISCTFGIATDQPIWICEQSISIQPLSDSEKTSSIEKSYIYGYTYGYPVSQSSVRMPVDHYADSDFQMIVYGPASEVNVTIAGHPYAVHYKVESGEYMTIDSRSTQPADRRVFLTKSNGEKVNLFNYRDSENSVMQKIPPGEVMIDYSRLYGIDLTLFLERSEPKWK